MQKINSFGPPRAKFAKLTRTTGEDYANEANGNVFASPTSSTISIGSYKRSLSNVSALSSAGQIGNGGTQTPLHVIPTVDLTVGISACNSNHHQKSSISPLVGRLQLLNNNNSSNYLPTNGHMTASTKSEASPPLLSSLVQNGSFGSFFSLSSSTSTVTAATIAIPTQTGHGHNVAGSQFETPRQNNHTSQFSSASSVTSTSALSLTQSFSSLSESPTYSNLGRVVFGVDCKPMRLFFRRALYFSNHHPCERLCIDGVNYSCTEQFYMFYKARVFGDMESAKAIMAINDTKTIKRIGSNIANFDQDRWFPVSILVMTIASLRKYEQNPDLRRRLFHTIDSELVEASPSDARWGIGLNIDSHNVHDKSKWRGLNIMGRLLTRLRDRLARRPEFAAEVREVYAHYAKHEADYFAASAGVEKE